MFDNDEGGERAKQSYDRYLNGCKTYDIKYPANKKDPQECSKKEIQEMLKNKKSPLSMLFT